MVAKEFTSLAMHITHDMHSLDETTCYCSPLVHVLCIIATDIIGILCLPYMVLTVSGPHC